MIERIPITKLDGRRLNFNTEDEPMKGINIGDKVKIDYSAVICNGMEETPEQSARLTYIREHPDEVYTVKEVNIPLVLAPIKLDHPILGETSFHEEELKPC